MHISYNAVADSVQFQDKANENFFFLCRVKDYQTTDGFYITSLKLSGYYMYCIVVGSRRLMSPDALQPKAYCTNPGL